MTSLQIETQLQSNTKSLSDYPTMPELDMSLISEREHIWGARL